MAKIHGFASTNVSGHNALIDGTICDDLVGGRLIVHRLGSCTNQTGDSQGLSIALGATSFSEKSNKGSHDGTSATQTNHCDRENES